MARYPIQPSTRGAVKIPDRRFMPGPLSAEAARDLTEAFDRVRAALNGGLSLGDGSDGTRAGNLAAQVRVVTTPATPGDSFVVVHGLARPSVGYLAVKKSAACDVFDADDHASNDSELWLQASAGGVELTLLLI